MKQAKVFVTAAIAISSFISLGVWCVSAQPQPETVRYSQIKTDSVTVYPYVSSPDRVYFVEKVY